jgi:hypothetical protein
VLSRWHNSEHGLVHGFQGAAFSNAPVSGLHVRVEPNATIQDFGLTKILVLIDFSFSSHTRAAKEERLEGSFNS